MAERVCECVTVRGHSWLTKDHLITAANSWTFLSRHHVTDDGSLSAVQLTVNSLSLFQNSMNLPPDKARLLRQYDNEKKWELICDQVGIDRYHRCPKWWLTRWGRLYARLVFHSTSNNQSTNIIWTCINDPNHFLTWPSLHPLSLPASSTLIWPLWSSGSSGAGAQKTTTCCQ